MPQEGERVREVFVMFFVFIFCFEVFRGLPCAMERKLNASASAVEDTGNTLVTRR